MTRNIVPIDELRKIQHDRGGLENARLGGTPVPLKPARLVSKNSW